MILTDREIQIGLTRKQIVIDPAPQSDAYSSTSVDLTLDPVLTLFDVGEEYVKKVVDPTHAQYNTDRALKELTKSHTIDAKTGFDLIPRHLILGWTREYVRLPIDARLAARVEGKSSLARMGIGVHITAPTIHAGFEGQIRLEIVNHGHLPITLRPDMKICQLIFEQTLGTPQKGYQGQFSGQAAR
ncbi:MAG TPA: dCTP deaminase [Rhodopseudomonas sp.]|uniref:dCTP deaminase n=1 Tax=Rhodopseudomonas sp. TaxID=1078 RepID=UPI002EDB37B0